jgi:phosphoserine phosphatase
MKNKIILYDFDKTLTVKDTLLGFYLEVSKFKKRKYLFMPLYFAVMISHKFKLISNTKLKKIGIYLFLKNQKYSEIQNISSQYSKKIIFNKLFEKITNNNKIKIVITASFEIYVSKVLNSNFIVHGSTLKVKNNIIIGLDKNLFGVEKLIFFKKKYPRFQIDEFYTDSYSDLPLLNNAKKKYLVKKNKFYKLN